MSIIYTLCVCQETGKYLAIDTEDPDRKVVASSEDEALGMLVRNSPGIKIDNVCHIDTVWTKQL